MSSSVNNKLTPFAVFLFILASVLIISPLFQQGWFIDGLIYKTVATNYLSEDARFWEMKFNDVSMNPFYEQPPLFFIATAIFYKIFGNGFLTDKFLTLIYLGLSIFFLFKICKHFFKEDKPAFYIVLFLLLTIPVFCWTYVNQVIEVLVLPLVLSAFYFFLQFRKSEKISQHTFYLVCFSASVILLFLTKGFQS